MSARVINPPLTQYMLCSPSRGRRRGGAGAKRPGRGHVRAAGQPGGGGQAHPAVRLVRGVRALAAAGRRPRARAWTRRRPSSRRPASPRRTYRSPSCRTPIPGAEIYHMAETGLCEHGAQQQLLDLGETAPTGRLPINTDGGCLANGEPVGASGLRQVTRSSCSCRDAPARARWPGHRRSASPTCTARRASARARY